LKIHLINLERSPQRLTTFLEANGHLNGLERFPAVDGKLIDRKALEREGVIDGALPYYTDGAVGAALSHLKLWDLAIESGQPVTLAEDDAIFHHRFEEYTSRLLASLPDDWDYVLWGWNFDSILAFDLLPGVSACVAQFNQEQMRQNVQAYQAMSLSPMPYRLHRAFGLPSYTVSPLGAQRLKDFCLPLREMSVFYPGLNRHLPNRALDDMLNSNYPDSNSYVSVPPLVLTKNEHAISTIQTGLPNSI
jgi:glycosyl transferase, family 25